MRIILFTGKGGVGKTTVAAATAYKAAKLGYKTLVISTDPAHSLSDALNVELGPEPVQVKDNLWGQELDVYYSMKKYWSNMRELMLTLFRWQGVDSVLAEEMSALPGMEEASAFLWIEKYYSEGEFDLIVIDSAPTGETLTLLTLPQVTRWWVSKAFPLQRFAIKSIGSVVRGTTGIPLDKGYEELQNLFEKLEFIQTVFSNPEICSIRLVCNPEKMVINESKRAYTYFQLYGYNVDAVIINRIIPEMKDPGVFAGYIQSQKKYIQDIEESFKPLPIFKIKHIGQEVFGLTLLNKVGSSIYGKKDPLTIFFQDEPFSITEIRNGYLLRMKVPFLKEYEEKKFIINKFGDELVIELGNRRKNIFLPKFVNYLKMSDYRYNDPWLEVEFLK